ncbi:MAG: hypothetical protein ACLFNU_09045 [Bacteroidales bacterium]
MCILRTITSILLITLSICTSALSQDGANGNKEDIRQSASDSLFMAGLYSDALVKYEEELERYPQDPKIHYKAGICYLESTRQLDKAIEHLKFASTRDVPNLVYYHLGKAYMKNYQFDEAISFLRRFTVNGGDPTVSNKEIELLASQCENGNFMLRYIFKPEVIDRKRVAQDEMYNYIITKSEGGSFIPVPEQLKSTVDKKENDTSMIFYPINPEPGDKIVFSSYGGTKSIGKDLFIIEMLEDSLWSKPEPLGDAVNSNYTEEFAYLAPDGVTLYFSSEGHYSIGGYDIYKSIYNPSVNKWSSPENLGFPFSSPFNDYLFVPSEDESMAIFVTDRNTASDSVDVVLIRLDEDPIRRSIDDKNEILRIAQLNPNILKDKTIGSAPNTVSKQKSADKSASFRAVENDPEYSRALAAGFQQQMKADSLKIKLGDLRNKFDYIDTADERRALEKRVVAVEDTLLKAQRNADIQFALASRIEQEYLTGKRKPTDKPTATFSSDNPDYLYQAQFAPTVFQSNEIEILSQLEKQTSTLSNLRSEVLELREKSRNANSKAIDDKYNDKLEKFNSKLSTYTATKKKIYNECISVAMMKSNTSNNPAVRNEIDKANAHFRSAKAIRNNAADDTKHESEFEALLLDELGVLRLEIAFAKIWDMKLFEQQLLSKIYRYEKSIFGHKLPNTPIAYDDVDVSTQSVPESESISITKIETHKVATDTFTFETDKDPDFDILEKSPYSEENPIPSHTPLPDGVIYKIQLAAFSKQISYDFFKGMVPITAEPINNGKVTKYYVGNFKFLSNAEKALPKVKSNGFKDAFIVAWHNGRNVALSRAEKLEESGGENSKEDMKFQTRQDDKLYVIQLGTYKGRLPDDIMQTIRALAPGKDLVRKPDGKDSFIYTIGSYSNATEATRIKDNLVAGGIKNAFLVAIDLDN